MAPPSKLSIAKSSLQRLVKEEASYHQEADKQQKRINSLQADTSADENREYVLKQERKALEETQALFPGLKQQIRGAVQQLEEQLSSPPDGASSEDIEQAKKVLEAGKKALDSS